MPSQITDVPFHLRANDIVKHVINIDSRFRDPDPSSSPSDFSFRLLSPVRNVLRIRITSIEFPNNFYMFTALRRNTLIKLQFVDTDNLTKILTIRIPDGNYLLDDMRAILVSYISQHMVGFNITFSGVTGGFLFSWNKPFVLDTMGSEYDTYDRPFDYGLGYNLGFSRGSISSVGPDASGNHFIESDQKANFAGDSYVFIKINNFDCIRQTVIGNDFSAMAKIIITSPKDYTTYDDYSGNHAKEFTFPTPYDLKRFRIQLLDAYGEIIDMESCQFSFSMEVLEVKNLNLYNTLRDAFADGWKV